MSEDDLKEAYNRFKATKDASDFDALDDLAEALGRYQKHVREQNGERGGVISPNRIVAMLAGEVLRDWEIAEWSHE